jgi:apolipoprotein N-acyltransferase
VTRVLPAYNLMLRRSPKPQPASLAAAPARFWLSSTLWLGLAGSLLLWLSFPPANLWPLAWLAPLPWLWLIRKPQLPGKRPYLALWLAGLAHWLAMLQGIRLAHPALYAGWFVLAAYLAIYLPVFIGLSRVAVRQLKVSLVVAAPVIWVGLELLRGHLVTGFSLSLLSHTQAEWPLLLQISDLAGAYAVSFVLMTAAAAIATVVDLFLASGVRQPPADTSSRTPFVLRGIPPVLYALALFSATLVYGSWRLNQPADPEAPKLRVALIQGSRDTQLESDPEQASNFLLDTFTHYQSLTNRARHDNARLDLVVWPESAFVIPEVLLADGESRDNPREIAVTERFATVLAGESARVNTLADGTPQPTPTLLLVGGNSWLLGPGEQQRSYNAALLADPAGNVVGRYYKEHAVMFGEYIPLADLFPFIYNFVPISDMSVGDGPRAFRVGQLTLAPSICFESTVPHLIRRHVVELTRHGTPPDILVNVTNDGWFFGSSILDHHLRCSVFRAIENRRPMIIAANTGFSAWIDGNGRIRAMGPRRAPAALVADVQPDGRTSPYHALGDWPASLCALACLLLAAVGSVRGGTSQ